MHPGRPKCAEEYIHVLCCEDGADGRVVFSVPVAQYEARGLHTRAEFASEVTGLLCRPGPGRVSGDAGDVRPTAVLQERHCVPALSENGVHGEEVRGDDPLGLGREELASLGPDRRGAGSIPAACNIPQTVDAAIGCPNRAGSPWIRRCPHGGLSPARRSTSVLSAAAVGGRPVRTRRAE